MTQWEIPIGGEVVMRSLRDVLARGVLMRRVELASGRQTWLPVHTCAPPPECAHCLRFLTDPRTACPMRNGGTCRHWSEL